jgi:hypothetical protein
MKAEKELILEMLVVVEFEDLDCPVYVLECEVQYTGWYKKNGKNKRFHTLKQHPSCEEHTYVHEQ